MKNLFPFCIVLLFFYTNPLEAQDLREMNETMALTELSITQIPDHPGVRSIRESISNGIEEGATYTAGDVKMVALYEFNERGQVTSQQIGEQEIQKIHRYGYDDAGLMTFFSELDGNEKLVEKIEIEYNGKGQLYKAKSTVPVFEEVTTTVFVWHNGTIQEFEVFDREGKVIQYIDYLPLVKGDYFGVENRQFKKVWGANELMSKSFSLFGANGKLKELLHYADDMETLESQVLRIYAPETGLLVTDAMIHGKYVDRKYPEKALQNAALLREYEYLDFDQHGNWRKKIEIINAGEKVRVWEREISYYN